MLRGLGLVILVLVIFMVKADYHTRLMTAAVIAGLMIFYYVNKQKR